MREPFGTSILAGVFAAVGRNRRCTRDIRDAKRNVKIGFFATPPRDDAMPLQTPSQSSEFFWVFFSSAPRPYVVDEGRRYDE